MNEVKKLVDKFWSEDISLAEKRKLLLLINKKAAELKSDLKHDYDLELASVEGEITERRFQDILVQLHDRIDDQEVKTGPKIFPLYQWIKAVAALLIMALVTALYFNHNHTPKKQVLADHYSQIKKEILRQPYNSGKSAIIIHLSDGSRVTLQPESSLSYYEPFDSKTRNISLKGEATFKVAKDKHHPFIVNANGFTTTALGTEFTINTFKQNKVVVKLLEGKVIVKAASGSSMGMKDVYLTPGEQLTINTKLKSHALINFQDPKKSVKLQSNQNLPPGAALVFNETPLSEVFNNLAKRYHAKVVYDGIEEAELQQLYFTGTFDGTEKMDTILPVICNMNGLTFKRNTNGISISKQK